MRHNFKKIISMILTVCMLLGTMAMLIPVTASAATEYPIYLEKNKTATINGITYRFDTDTSKHPDSWARVNEDGTFEISFRYGDTLWFPNVELTAASEIHAEITNTASAAMEKAVAGVAYGITPDANGRYDDEMVAAIHTGGRMRIARADYVGNHTYVDGFGGNGGYDRMNSYDTSYANTWANSSAWAAVKNSNKCLASGKTVTFDVKKLENGDVSVAYGAQGSTFVTRTYNNSTSFESNTTEPRPFEGGAVGFSCVYSYDESYAQCKLTDLTVKNCKVDGVAVESFTAKATPAEAPETSNVINLTPNADNWINGQNYRLETSKEDSYAKIEDGKLTNVSFLGGCNGNLKGISALCKGMKIEDVIEKLQGIRCGFKNTSCPDQFAKAP